jgi:hypothetical protein
LEGAGQVAVGEALGLMPVYLRSFALWKRD